MSLNKSFQKAHKVYWHDRVLEKSVLRFIPDYILPNHITMFRLAMTPFVSILMLREHYAIGLVAFLIVSFTDALDGSLARTKNQVTEWGKVYDPLADKVLISCMVFVIVYRYIDVLTSFVIVGLEIVIVIAAWVRKSEGRIVEANVWGKIKMLLQVLGVSLLLVGVNLDIVSLIPYASGVLYLAIAFSVVSLLTHGV